jgi:hypothetical protein
LPRLIKNLRHGRSGRVTPKDRASWRRLLVPHHFQPAGVWFLIRKKAPPPRPQA